MTDRERAHVRELLRLSTRINSGCHALLSDCQDSERRIVADEGDVVRQLNQDVEAVHKHGRLRE